MKTILLAGYGWFASIPEGETNNAELIARALDGEILTLEDGTCARVHSVVMPVVWAEALDPVFKAVDRLQPDVVLALGTDASAAAMRPEPWGVNYMRGKDAARDGRETDMHREILDGGAAALRGTLPYDGMTRAMLAAGVPARTGTLEDAPPDYPAAKKSSTGLYLCNYMAYHLALLAGKRPGLRAGFMHVPTQPAYACARRLLQCAQDEALLCREMPPSLPLETMIRGTREALLACLRSLSGA